MLLWGLSTPIPGYPPASSCERPRCLNGSMGGIRRLRGVMKPSGPSTGKLRTSHVVCTYPEPETEKERSPLDYPQEWVTPQPSRRPDIFPEFEKLDTPLPKPLPGDPEQPDEEEEVEKEKKREPSPDPEEDEEEEEEEDDEKDPKEPIPEE